MAKGKSMDIVVAAYWRKATIVFSLFFAFVSMHQHLYRKKKKHRNRKKKQHRNRKKNNIGDCAFSFSEIDWHKKRTIQCYMVVIHTD